MWLEKVVSLSYMKFNPSVNTFGTRFHIQVTPYHCTLSHTTTYHYMLWYFIYPVLVSRRLSKNWISFKYVVLWDNVQWYGVFWIWKISSYKIWCHDKTNNKQDWAPQMKTEVFQTEKYFTHHFTVNQMMDIRNISNIKQMKQLGCMRQYLVVRRDIPLYI